MKKFMTMKTRYQQSNKVTYLTIRTLLFAMFVAVCLTFNLCSATTYDAAADSSTTNNPNGVWSYGWSSMLTSTLNVCPDGSGGEYCHARWTAPDAGIFDITAEFSGVDFVAGTTTDVHVSPNGVSLFNGSVDSFVGYDDSASFGPTPSSSFSTTAVPVSNGDIIDFTVGFGSNGNFYYDTTTPSATISTVPEPATILLLGLGGLVFVIKR